MVNNLYSSLSQEASPHIKDSTVSWQLAHYSILLQASGLIIIVFNLKHGYCPAWLPLRRCVVLHLGLKQEKGSPRSTMQRPFIECQQLQKKKKTMKKKQVLAETPNETIYTQLGTLSLILPSRELIKNVTSHNGDHKQFLSLLLWCHFFLLHLLFLCLYTKPSLYESQGCLTAKNEFLISL